VARNHARVHVAIWQDDDFLALRPSVQRLYLFLLSQPNLTHLGVLPLTLRRWARSADAYSLDDLRDDLAELEEARFVVVDEEAEEVLVRSLLRGDGVYKQPNVMRSAISSAPAIHSDRIKRALGDEVERITLDDLADSKREEAEGLLRTLGDALAVAEPKGSPNPKRGVPDTPSEGVGEPPTHAHAQPLVLSPSPTPSSGEVRPARPDTLPGFDAFWEAYPRRIGKEEARKAYRKALKLTTPDVILAGAKRYRREVEKAGTEMQFVKHPGPWLNAGRWEDEEPPPPQRRLPGTVHPHQEWATLG
jgi:hypothetical protein